MDRAETELGHTLIEHLSQLPGIEILEVASEQPSSTGAIDQVIALRCKGEPVQLLVEFKVGKLHPKNALRAIEKLRGQGLPMLVASSLSEASRSLLRDNNVAYWDLSGSLYLDLPMALYMIDKPAPATPRENRELKNPYRGSSAQVLHALLLKPEKSWKVTELAEAAMVSPYTSHQVLDYLEKQLWCIKEGRGPQGVRRLSQPGKLLDSWAEHHSWEDYQPLRLHRFSKTQQTQREQLSEFLNSQRLPWVLTLEHGAQALTPFVTKLPATVTVIAPASNPWLIAAKEFGYREVHNGENLLLWLVKDQVPFIGRRQLEGSMVASSIQLYLDLFKWPRRGREQAQHLRERAIGF